MSQFQGERIIEERVVENPRIVQKIVEEKVVRSPLETVTKVVHKPVETVHRVENIVEKKIDVHPVQKGEYLYEQFQKK